MTDDAAPGRDDLPSEASRDRKGAGAVPGAAGGSTLRLLLAVGLMNASTDEPLRLVRGVFGHRELEIVRVPMAPEETLLANSASRDVKPSGARRSTRLRLLKLDEQGFFAEPAP